MPRTAKAGTLRQPVTMSGELTARIMFAGRSSSMSAQIVAWVRDALFAKKLKPGDFLGTEKDLAARFKASRIVARDAVTLLTSDARAGAMPKANELTLFSLVPPIYMYMDG